MPRREVTTARRRGAPVARESSVAQVLEDAKNTDFRDPAACRRFQETHRSRLAKDPNVRYAENEILNELARCKNLSVFRNFTKWAVQNHRSLLQCKTDGGHTPLHLAIRFKQHEFVGLVLRYAEDVPSLLCERTDLDMTCLHLAIDHRSPFTEEMIARCLEKLASAAGYASAQTAAFKAAASTPGHPANGFGRSFSGPSGPVDIFTVMSKERSYDGMTPLHMAVVSIDHMADDDSFLLQPGPTHSTTKASGGGSKAKQASQEQEAPSMEGGLDKFVANKGLRRAPTLDMGRIFLSSTGPETPITRSIETPLEDFDLLRDARVFSLLSIVKKLVDASPRVLVEFKDADGNTPFQAALEDQKFGKLADFEKLRTDAQRESWRHELIEKDPMLSYLRTYIIDKFDRRDAMRALYKVGDERVLEFDLSGLPYSSINSEFLFGLGKVLRFEGLLKYVALPRVAVEVEDELDGAMVRRQDQGTKATPGNGLQHMCSVFRWLRRHHVKSVLKVTVVDDVEPSHSGEAIEECLKGLDVRIWNWYKVDLCANVIIESAPNVREVTLYSSGNNAVLVGWSSTAGLPKLNELKKVRVFVQEGLERPAKLRKYIDEFETELKKNRKGVQVQCELHKPNSDYNNVFEPGEGKATESKWMQTMERFADFLKSVKPGPGVRPIKIAIIDDGIDMSSDIFTDKIQVGESFYQLSEMFGRRGCYYVPTGKHGTLMAQSICKVCPPVKLYIAQLEVLPGQNGQRSFTAQSATEAIEWAVNQGVDIISMSWSISSRNVLKRLEDAVRRADKEGIIMFCASIDEGSSTIDKTYPGKAGDCIKIGASTGTGDKLSWVSESSCQFLLPGEVPQPVVSSSVLRTQGQPHPYMGMFGSSVSTALAAGLAGVLLYCDRLLESELGPSAAVSVEDIGTPMPSDMAGGGLDGGPDHPIVDELRMKNKMAEAFLTLSKGTDLNKFPQVWDHLPQNPEKLVWNKKADPDGTQRTIAELENFMKLLKR